MARQSMPADPVDDQITALRHLATQTKIEMETMRSQYEAERLQTEQTIMQQKEHLARWTLEKRNLHAELQFVNSVKEEREKELAYLQDQLEIVSGEKQVLKDTIISLESKVDEARALQSELETVKEAKEVVEEELGELRDENSGLRERVLEVQNLRDQIDDLNHQISLLQQQNNRLAANTTLTFSPVSSLQDLQHRIETLTRTLQA